MWIASDSLGQVGSFVTGGQGPIPISLIERGEEFIGGIEASLFDLPICCDSILANEFGMADDFIDLATRGFFVFDWSDVYRTQKHELNVYELKTIPIRPLLVQDLPKLLRDIAESNVIKSVEFQMSAQIDVNSCLRCMRREW